ncbi:Protein O-glucosyltransferase 1 [Pseudocercospora fuligena]|uniref:Protein O-glucosyltransferase 1 n=1 Tax=Pseudocercospora fuligena TaxID=685502 RepID=A0A8H6RFN4_9PEZI|nr:Protein O-glucosyltransferase 1 [Pseudocercospora fuligena]
MIELGPAAWKLKTATGKNGWMAMTLHPAFWKAVSAFLLLCVLVQQYALSGTRTSAVQQAIHSTPHIEAPEFTGPNASSEQELDQKNESLAKITAQADAWSYSWARDADNHGLSEQQCDSAFPNLWNEIERSEDFWKEKRIGVQDIELFAANDGGVRVLLANSQLRIIKTKGLHRDDFRHRIIAVLQQLLRAITAAEAVDEPIPDIEFTVVVDDKAVPHPEKNGAYFAFARAYANRRHDSLWITPDFHFFGAPPEAGSFREMREKFRKHDSPLAKKIQKVVWRGATWTNPEVREPLLNETEGQTWADVKAMSWEDPASIMPMEAFCKYKYVVNTEGRAWSARMTHLLNCDSLLLVHDVEWIAHYYHLLDTDSNCVHVARNFSDLGEKIQYYNTHADEAQKIADNARTMFRERYTTPAATACYWRKLLRAYARVAFTPRTTAIKENKHKLASKEQLRGISFEEFIVHDNTQDYPYIPTKKPDEKAQKKPGARWVT